MALLNDVYDSPVTIIQSIRDQIEEDIKTGIFRIATKYAIDIDEEKLLQALRHDRERYSAAYQAGRKDGYRQALLNYGLIEKEGDQ